MQNMIIYPGQNDGTAAYPRYRNTGSNADALDRVIEDGSYLRFSMLTFGYNFKFKKQKRQPVSGLGLTFSIRNVFLWTDYTGYDPEVNSFTNSWNRVGIDQSSYPNSRLFIFGLTLDF